MNTKRPQRQKYRSGKVDFIQELRRSNAAQPIPGGNEYKRKQKYGIKYEIDDDNDLSAFEWQEVRDYVDNNDVSETIGNGRWEWG